MRWHGQSQAACYSETGLLPVYQHALDALRHFKDLLLVMSHTWGLTAGCDSCQTGHQDNTTTVLTLTSTFDWPSIALQVCPENTQWSDTGRKQPWIAACGNRKAPSAPDGAECLRAGSERTSSNKQYIWCFSLKSEQWRRLDVDVRRERAGFRSDTK